MSIVRPVFVQEIVTPMLNPLLPFDVLVNKVRNLVLEALCRSEVVAKTNIAAFLQPIECVGFRIRCDTVCRSECAPVVCETLVDGFLAVAACSHAALTDFFRNNGHGFMNADAALANGVDAMLSTFNGEENNVANPEHPTSVLQMRNACKNVMYTVVSSWAYDGEHEETGMENWKKAGIGIDIVIALFMAGMEVLVIRGYKKRKNAE